MLALHLEKDLELKMDFEVLRNWDWGPIFWKVTMEQFGPGREGKE